MGGDVSTRCVPWKFGFARLETLAEVFVKNEGIVLGHDKWDICKSIPESISVWRRRKRMN